MREGQRGGHAARAGAIAISIAPRHRPRSRLQIRHGWTRTKSPAPIPEVTPTRVLLEAWPVTPQSPTHRTAPPAGRAARRLRTPATTNLPPMRTARALVARSQYTTASGSGRQSWGFCLPIRIQNHRISPTGFSSGAAVYVVVVAGNRPSRARPPWPSGHL